jgi:sugar transferase (PEP-CTERM/EpsH1 system associated)
MDLLFLTPQLPYPPRQGTTLRNFGLIAHLAARHRIDLVTFLAAGEHLAPGNPLLELCRTVVALPQPIRATRERLETTLTSHQPDMALRLEDSGMHEAVRAQLARNEYDVVQVEGIEMAQYARHVSTSQAVVFDDHNCEYLLQRRNALTDLRIPTRWHAAAYSFVQWRKLRSYEAEVCRQADAVLAVSEPDKMALQAIAPGANIAVVPNGIDLEAYPVAPARPRSQPAVVLFTGKMDYRPNVDAVLWFGEEVLPKIHEQNADVLFRVVGMNPHPRLDVLRGNPRVELTGSVPAVRPYLETATVYVIPMRVGGGTRFKALEAMASGVPVVSTTLGVEGIPVRNGREMLLADDPEEFAAAVLKLLDDRRAGDALTQDLVARAHTLVADEYTWETIIPQLEAIYANLRRASLTNTPR